MNFADDDEWDLELLDKLVESEEQAIAARRSASQPTPLPLPPSPLSLSLRRPPIPTITTTPTPIPTTTPTPPLPAHCEPPALVLDLQQRLRQAEQELGELRRKVLHPALVATPTLEQELRRLQSEVLFKDQEILEAKRACTEKSEQLKRAIAETEDLRRKGSEDVKRVKWQASIPAVTKHNEERKETVSRTSKTSAADITDSPGPPNQEVWCPPWTLSGRTGSAQGLSKSRNSSPKAVQSHCATLDNEDPVSIRDLKTRVLDNGCTSSGEKENGSQSQVNGNNIESNTETEGKGVIDKTSWERLLQSTLFDIWYPRNLKEESKVLLSKVFAVCEADLQVLLSVDIGATQHLPKHRILRESSALTSKKGLSYSLGDIIDGGSANLGTHSLPSIIAKVSNGLLSPWILLTTVLDLCEVDNIQVCESALRVLHCILVHDQGCHRKIFGRDCFRPHSEMEHQRSAGVTCVVKGPGGFDVSVRALDGSVDSVMGRRYFSSPRISLRNEVFCQSQPDAKDSLSLKTANLHMNDTHAEQKNSRCVASMEHDNDVSWAMKIFKGILAKAVAGSNEAIKATATSVLVTLVMNAQPIGEREQFGFILFDGSLGSLLRTSACLDVRLQAVRLIHSLLHCPDVLKKLFDSQGQEPTRLTSKSCGENSRSVQELDFEAKSSEEVVLLKNGKEINPQLEAAGDVSEQSSLEVLDGLILCLLLSDTSNQSYSLRRNALRALTFVATSGQKGATFLLCKEVALNKDEVMRKESNGILESRSSAFTSGSLPVHLIALLDQQLKIEEDRSSALTNGQSEEREFVIHEALMLLCRLASHPSVSSITLAAITGNKDITRLSISVTNRLMGSAAFSESPTLQGRSSTTSSSLDTVELCRGLRRRILASISNL